MNNRKYLRVFVFIITIVLFLCSCGGKSKRSSFPADITPEEEQLIDGLSDYFDFNAEITEIVSDYTNSKTSTEEVDNATITRLVDDYARKLFEEDKIQDYHTDPGESVWMKFNSGIEYMYIPLEEGYDSYDIGTYQPCLDMYDYYIRNYSVEKVDGSAADISGTLDDYYCKTNLDNDAVTLDTIKDIANHDIVIWHGHGGYNSKTHSTLLTSLKLDESKFWADPIYTIRNLKYTSDFDKGGIICTSTGYIAITYKFILEHLNNIQSKIIYLGTCSSGRDAVLAKAFLVNGAQAVLANSGVIHTLYNLDMIDSVFGALLEDSSSNTVEQALEKAKLINGEYCCNYNEHSESDGTEVLLFGDPDIKLFDQISILDAPYKAYLDKLKENTDAILATGKNEYASYYTNGEGYKKTVSLEDVNNDGIPELFYLIQKNETYVDGDGNPYAATWTEAEIWTYTKNELVKLNSEGRGGSNSKQIICTFRDGPFANPDSVFYFTIDGRDTLFAYRYQPGYATYYDIYEYEIRVDGAVNEIWHLGWFSSPDQTTYSLNGSEISETEFNTLWDSTLEQASKCILYATEWKLEDAEGIPNATYSYDEIINRLSNY
ncbi:MAG: hypothetical protein IJM53_00765 [Lachnospiraceae bacterium]|nr:hypothetical protein [Lachnospiraceae bacterium]